MQNRRTVEVNNMAVLVSYKTPVAVHDLKSGNIFVTSQKFSVTTSKHINQWMKEYGLSKFSAFNPIKVTQAEIERMVGGLKFL